MHTSWKLVLVGVILSGLYWTTRLVNLTMLPVFADEAIYIRWAQMIITDPQQYFFIPMYDGKPPLHMWLLTTLLPLFPLNPLLASRLFSTATGFVNLLLVIAVTGGLGGTSVARLIAGLLYIFLPFTLFHDRMGLIDSLLLTGLLISLNGLMRLPSKKRWPIVMTGVGFGLALMTKTTALFFGPILAAKALMDYLPKRNVKVAARPLIALALGLGMFALLRVSPLFPFLFSRSGDFSYSPLQVVREWGRPIGRNSVEVLGWMGSYLTWPLLLVSIISPVYLWKKQRRSALLIMAGFVFIAPLVIIGKAIVPRYFLPFVGFVLPSISIALAEIGKKIRLVPILTLISVIGIAISFGLPLIFNSNQTPFVSADRTQYLTSWSSGHGIPEVREFLVERAKYGRVVVATEGYFGTLPDGLLMYIINHPAVKNLEIFGVGQPITNLNQDFVKKAQMADEAYIVVNEDRLQFKYEECCRLVHYYQRPYNAPALLLLQYKNHE